MNEKEQAFWNLIQQSAKKEQAVFFMDVGEGHDINTEQYEGENFSGWLIPEKQAPNFRRDWEQNKENDDKWDSFYRFAEWKEMQGKIEIEFSEY